MKKTLALPVTIKISVHASKVCMWLPYFFLLASIMGQTRILFVGGLLGCVVEQHRHTCVYNSTGPLLLKVKASRLPAIDAVLLMELRRGAGGRVEGEVLLKVCVRSTGGTVDVPCIRVAVARFFHGWMIENEKFVDGGLSQ